MKTPVVYVVIVTYNPKKWISKCFPSLKESTIHLKTIVIDNCSTDGSQEIIKKDYPEVEFIQSDKNLGFGLANNLGIKKAYDNGAEYVFLLNQDAWIDNNTIEKLVEMASQNSEYGILSPFHLNGEGTSIDSSFSYYIAASARNTLVSDLYFKKFENKIYNLGFVNAAAWLLSRKCIENIGGFNPSFFHYSEDENYCQRLKYHGLKLGVVPMVNIYHDRDNRDLSNHHTEFKIKFKRMLITEFSNPNGINLIKFLLKKYKVLELGKTLNKLNVLLSIDLKYIFNNRSQSRKKAKSFL